MVGQIGGLQRAGVPPKLEMQAVDRAFVLVQGWQQKDRGAIRAALNELREAAEHNQAIYDQASAALNELSARQKTVTDGEAALEKARQKFAADSEMARSRDEQRAAKLTVEEADLASRKAAFERESGHKAAEFRERDEALTVREDAVTSRENTVSEREAKATAVETANAAMRAELQSIVGEIKGFAVRAEKALK